MFMGFMAVFHNNWRISMRLFLPLPLFQGLIWWFVLSKDVRYAAESSRRSQTGHDPIINIGDRQYNVMANHTWQLSRAASTVSRPPSAYLSHPRPYISLHPDVQNPRTLSQDLKNRFCYLTACDQDETMSEGSGTPEIRQFVSVQIQYANTSLILCVSFLFTAP